MSLNYTYQVLKLLNLRLLLNYSIFWESQNHILTELWGLEWTTRDH